MLTHTEKENIITLPLHLSESALIKMQLRFQLTQPDVPRIVNLAHLLFSVL